MFFNLINKNKKIYYPNHIAIIPDGNRRWAKKHLIPKSIAYKKAGNNFLNILNYCLEKDIKYVTFWAFSTENWNRPENEIKIIFELLNETLNKILDKTKKGIKFVHLGRKDRMPNESLKLIEKLEKKTNKENKITLLLAIDYGGQDEILRAINSINKKNLTFEDINKNIESSKFSKPDLIIRTSGEIRTSGFYLWNGAYAEWFFCKKYFPDFSTKKLEKAIISYNNRKRNFGK